MTTFGGREASVRVVPLYARATRAQASATGATLRFAHFLTPTTPMGSRGSRYLRGSMHLIYTYILNGAAGLTTRYILREGAHGQPALGNGSCQQRDSGVALESTHACGVAEVPHRIF